VLQHRPRSPARGRAERQRGAGLTPRRTRRSRGSRWARPNVVPRADKYRIRPFCLGNLAACYGAGHHRTHERRPVAMCEFLLELPGFAAIHNSQSAHSMNPCPEVVTPKFAVRSQPASTPAPRPAAAPGNVRPKALPAAYPSAPRRLGGRAIGAECLRSARVSRRSPGRRAGSVAFRSGVRRWA